jgi:hypothetical protein
MWSPNVKRRKQSNGIRIWNRYSACVYTRMTSSTTLVSCCFSYFLNDEATDLWNPAALWHIQRLANATEHRTSKNLLSSTLLQCRYDSLTSHCYCDDIKKYQATWPPVAHYSDRVARVGSNVYLVSMGGSERGDGRKDARLAKRVSFLQKPRIKRNTPDCKLLKRVPPSHELRSANLSH